MKTCITWNTRECSINYSLMCSTASSPTPLTFSSRADWWVFLFCSDWVNTLEQVFKPDPQVWPLLTVDKGKDWLWMTRVSFILMFPQPRALPWLLYREWQENKRVNEGSKDKEIALTSEKATSLICHALLETHNLSDIYRSTGDTR